MSNVRPFGTLPDGRRVDEYTLTNNNGMSLSIIPYGAIVTRLLVRDRNGQQADVVCGFDSLDPYLAGHPYFGCTAGRVAGRITRGAFTLNGVDYHLAVNDPPNHLHGGRIGFDKKLWQVDDVWQSAIFLSLLSPDGDEGYPGDVRVKASFRLDENGTVAIEYTARADATTPLSLTHHGYFNLAGEGSGSVDDHVLQIAADEYVPTDEAMTLLGRREPVTPANDFRTPRRLGDAINGLWQRHGDLYSLGDAEGFPDWSVARPVATLTHPGSGRVMTVSTTEPYLQLYTGVSLDGSLTGTSGLPYRQFGAICLEAERYPDGVNRPDLGDIVIGPDNGYAAITTYRFTTA